MSATDELLKGALEWRAEAKDFERRWLDAERRCGELERKLEATTELAHALETIMAMARKNAEKSDAG